MARVKVDSWEIFRPLYIVHYLYVAVDTVSGIT